MSSKVDLPMLPAGTRLEKALQVMRRVHRSAVLVPQNGDEYLLIDAADVVLGNNALKETLESLIGGLTMTLILRSQADPEALSFHRRRMIRDLGIQLMQVEIPNEELAVRVASEVRRFYCDGPRRHGFDPGEVFPGQECPTGDGAIIQG